MKDAVQIAAFALFALVLTRYIPPAEPAHKMEIAGALLLAGVK